MKNILNRTDRQIAVLDLEASALGTGSYPIELGVALVRLKRGSRWPVVTAFRSQL